MWGWQEGEDIGCVWKAHGEAGGFRLPLVDYRKEVPTPDRFKYPLDSQLEMSNR